jgi:hypothetical protein
MLHVITLIGAKRAEKLKEQAHRTMRPWVIWIALATVIFVHIAFGRSLSPAVPALAVLGVVILVAVKHVGLIASVLARFRRAAKGGE